MEKELEPNELSLLLFRDCSMGSAPLRAPWTLQIQRSQLPQSFEADRRPVTRATRAARINDGRCAAISRRGASRTFKLRRSTVSSRLYPCVPWKHSIHPGSFLIHKARRESKEAPRSSRDTCSLCRRVYGSISGSHTWCRPKWASYTLG